MDRLGTKSRHALRPKPCEAGPGYKTAAGAYRNEMSLAASTPDARPTKDDAA
jgi:hypothetical protein